VAGRIVRAVQANGATVETIEGLTASGEIADLQAAFVECNAGQCGFCTPGMLMCAAELLATQPDASRGKHPAVHLRELLPVHRVRGDRRRHRANRAGTREGVRGRP
jgi:aerobic-type carbon monoxide dehydrogenase small subunit (CoxS/CutS family)